jgi:sugar lactone lactonase YvrE
MRRVLISAAIAIAVASSTSGMRAAQLRARLFFLDIKGGRVVSANPDGSDVNVLLAGHRTGPDGIVVDVGAGHIFWTNMGKPMANDGSIERLDLDGNHLTVVVPRGGTFTPKQLKLDRESQRLYWSDREGMRVMRSNIDGSGIETLVETGSGEEARQDARNWCVGIAVDVRGGKIYWTQKGGSDAGEGSIRRAHMSRKARLPRIDRMSRCC